MDIGYQIGDRVVQIENGIIGKVIRFYRPTACKQQTMILCDDGRKYHAPSDTFIRVDEITKEIAKKIKDMPPQIAMEAGMPAAQEAAQPLLIPHDYRRVKVGEGVTITIDLEEMKRQLVESHYQRIGLNYGA